MLSNVTMIALSEAKATLEGKKFETATDLVKAAMAVTKDHWMEVEETGQFNAAVGAALLLATPEQKQQIEDSLKPLKALSALMSGVPVDMERVMADVPEPDKIIPLRKLWTETKKA